MLSKGQIIRGDPGALSQSGQEETFPSMGGKGSSTRSCEFS